MEPTLSQSAHPNLMQTPKMRFALQVLETPAYDLIPLLTKELEENPLLEWEEAPPIASLSPEYLEEKLSLTDHLLSQLTEKPPHAELLLGYLDRRGLIPTPLEEIAKTHRVKVGELARDLTLLQSLEPKGVCASSPRKALLAQLQKGIAYTLIEKHYEDLLKRRYKAIPFEPEEIERVIEEEIAPLNPYPGAGYGSGANPPLRPDLWIIEDEAGEFTVKIEEELKLKIASSYQERVGGHYLKEKLGKANWILRALAERRKTLLKIGELVVRKQTPFLQDRQNPLIPFTLSEASYELALSNSTISRAVANKTVSIPWGLIPLRSLFSHPAKEGISGHEMGKRLKREIRKEDPKAPLTDEQLSKALGCSRRAVTKYRHKLGIGNRRERRRYR